MKDTENTSPKNDELREEYDFAQMQGVRGKYYEQYQSGTNIVLIAPDIAEKFPTSEAVNEALRRYIEEHRDAA